MSLSSHAQQRSGLPSQAALKGRRLQRLGRTSGPAPLPDSQMEGGDGHGNAVPLQGTAL